uniref:Uncharacterized protein LOC111132789 n=1 Tax=Crassostrea virginica TaxID=6565 RepID=A0A8B8E856_CRAVI|nr:uncharacterized protein LOC111132789 [Crassostrea virginica]
MISSIDRSLRRHRYKESIMQSPANIFNATKQALKAKQKDLKQKGKGNRPKKADPLSDEEINILFDTGVLGVTSPESLLNTDSQDTINETQSQDLFERDPPVREEDSTLVPNGILRDILKELKDVRTKMDALQSFSNGPPTTTCSFRVEDQNFKRECKRHIGDDPYKFKTMCSYASHKFTQMRNQLRRQIFHSTLDVQGLSLDGLSSFLFKAFIPPGQSPLDETVRRMTVVIRAFLSQKKIQEGEKFWVELKAFYDTVILDQRSNIIDLLKDREERRIRRYVETHKADQNTSGMTALDPEPSLEAHT